jgi:hypothetical protein
MHKPKGLFINSPKAKDSIFESGWMVYNCLKDCTTFQLDYIEIDINNRSVSKDYNFYFLNYHPVTMGWLDTRSLRKNLGFVLTLVLEVAPNDPFVLCPSRHFDAYCVLDPTLKIKNKKVYPFPRPLEEINFVLPTANNEIPVIGSFGFATKGKGFENVVEAVNKEFNTAIIKINIPYGDFVPESKSYAEHLKNKCIAKAKPGIEVKVTHDFMDKDELIKWCANNTLNCFLYDRDMPGLAATTDQAIVSERPLSISANETFRHITQYLPPYPSYSLKDSINKSGPIIKQIKKEWSRENFANQFEFVLDQNKYLISSNFPNKLLRYILPVKNKTILDGITRRIKKYKRKLKKVSNALIKSNDSKYSQKII